MAVTKISVSLDEALVSKVDRLVQSHAFANRSQAIEAAVQDKISRIEKKCLARECAKLNRAEEQAFAEQGMAMDSELWPAY